MTRINESEYAEHFRNRKKRDRAFQIALDNRKFEIDMYWKRAAYFWTLIGASLLGYFTVITSKKFNVFCDSGRAAFFISCIGAVFSWSWFLANKGSKRWQENWENHIELLENAICGPIYKTVLDRHEESKSFFGADSYSVSTINVMTSFFVFLVWILLGFYVSGILVDGILVFSCKTDLVKAVFFIISFLFCALIKSEGRSHVKDHNPRADIRTAKIV